MSYQPNATDAKKIADDAVLASKQPATDTFIGDTLVAIANAAKAGQYAYSTTVDTSILDLERIKNVFSAQLGYTVIFPTVSTPLDVTFDWQSSARQQVAVPNSLNLNPKFTAN